MLLVREATTPQAAIRTVMKTHRLETAPTEYRSVYRPFFLGKSLYTAEDRNRTPVEGTVISLADARIAQWAILGAYRHRRIEEPLDLRAFQVNFVAEEGEPEPGAEVLEPLMAQENLPTWSKLMLSRRLLARTLKLAKIRFDQQTQYHLVYRPYWEIQFQPRRGDPDVALVSRDDLLIRR
jgi:hypothetical protein